MESTENIYTAAHKTAAYAPLADYGWLRVAGRDRLDLLHALH